jgi:alpha-D-xyloside xylohydrolase
VATYESMAESLRGVLSLGLSGFGFWSHDIGGFQNKAPAHVYKRWCAFGLLSSHRLHGFTSYRVPLIYDDEAVNVLRYFIKLKCRLVPYLFAAAAEAARNGAPMMRAQTLISMVPVKSSASDRRTGLSYSLIPSCETTRSREASNPG